MKIRNFRHKGLEAFSKKGVLRGIMPSHAARLRTCLSILENAETEQELSREAHLMTQGSKLSGFWAMKISAQWRLIFNIDDMGDCCNLDYLNYHH